MYIWKLMIVMYECLNVYLQVDIKVSDFYVLVHKLCNIEKTNYFGPSKEK